MSVEKKRKLLAGGAFALGLAIAAVLGIALQSRTALGWPTGFGGGTSGGGSGTVTSVTATSPFVISSTPTTTPNVTSSGAAHGLLGRAANSTGVLDMINAASDGCVYRRSGTTLACGDITEASVTSLTTDLAALTPMTRTLTGTAPITVGGDNSAHDLSANRTVAIVAASASVPGSMSAADKTKLDAVYNYTGNPWKARMLAFAQSKDATLTNPVMYSNCASLGLDLERDPTNSGTVNLLTTQPGGVIDMASTAVNGVLKILRNKEGSSSTAGLKAVVTSNTRTDHWMLCTRVWIKAANATTSIQIRITDEATAFDADFGIEGATSTTNWSMIIGSLSTVNTGVAFSTSGFENVCMQNDGTNMKLWDADTGTQKGSNVSNATIQATAGHFLAFSTQNSGSNANAWFDEIMVIGTAP